MKMNSTNANSEVREEVEEESAFNVESCESTQELEQLIKSEAIGSTLYNSRFVIQFVIDLTGKYPGASDDSAEEEEDLDSDLESRFASLVEMTFEKDVCAFLLEGGIAEMLLGHVTSNPNLPRSQELTLNVLANVLVHSDLFQDKIMRAKPGFAEQVTVHCLKLTFTCDSVPVLIACWQCLKNLSSRLFYLPDSEEQESDYERELASNFEEQKASMLSLLTDGSVVARISQFLGSSTNLEFLEKLCQYVIALFETSYEYDEDKFESCGFFSDSNFMLSACEALRLAMQKSAANVGFLISEIFGTICTEDCVSQKDAKTREALCDALALYVEKEGPQNEDLSWLATLTKTCHHVWLHQGHQKSYHAVKCCLESFTKESFADESSRAASEKVNACLKLYEERYSVT